MHDGSGGSAWDAVENKQDMLRVRELMAEAGEERTPSEVAGWIKKLAKQRCYSERDAIDETEERLLAGKPWKEEWE